MLVVRSVAVGPFTMNAYLVACSETGEALLIDPGAEIDRVLALAEPGWKVGRIFLTHGHVDHAAGVAEARAATGAPVTIHEADEPWLAALPRQAEMFGLGAVEAPRPDGRHADGEAVVVGRFTGRVIHSPGHSQGSCCLWFPEADVLVTGDTLFLGSLGRTDLPGGDHDTLLNSIRNRLFTLPENTVVHPGHGDATKIGLEKRHNPFLQ